MWLQAKLWFALLTAESAGKAFNLFSLYTFMAAKQSHCSSAECKRIRTRTLGSQRAKEQWPVERIEAAPAGARGIMQICHKLKMSEQSATGARATAPQFSWLQWNEAEEGGDCGGCGEWQLRQHLNLMWHCFCPRWQLRSSPAIDGWQMGEQAARRAAWSTTINVVIWHGAERA